MLWKIFIVVLVLLTIAVAAMSVRIILVRNGRFKSIDVGESEQMRQRGVKCTMEQDADERSRRNAIDVKQL